MSTNPPIAVRMPSATAKYFFIAAPPSLPARSSRSAATVSSSSSASRTLGAPGKPASASLACRTAVSASPRALVTASSCAAVRRSVGLNAEAVLDADDSRVPASSTIASAKLPVVSPSSDDVRASLAVPTADCASRTPIDMSWGLPEHPDTSNAIAPIVATTTRKRIAILPPVRSFAPLIRIPTGQRVQTRVCHSPSGVCGPRHESTGPELLTRTIRGPVRRPAAPTPRVPRLPGRVAGPRRQQG